MRQILFLLLFPLMLLWQPLQAQINIKIGYDLCFPDLPVMNELLEEYNGQSDLEFDQSFSPLRVLHGGMIGLRYRKEWFGLEAGWETRLAERNAEGTMLSTQQGFSRRLNVRYNAFSLLAGFYAQRFGLGGSVEAASFVVLSSEGQSSNRAKIVQEPLLTSQLFLAYELPTGPQSAISFRPYVQVPWSRIDLSGLEADLFPNTPVPTGGLQEDSFSFGLHIIFFNGPQQ